MEYYRYDENLASGTQPSAEDLQDLKEEGWEVVVNLSAASTRNALKDEASIVERLGMEYLHFPVDCSELEAFQYLTFKGILNGFAGRRIFVHCGGNIKSSNLIHMYQVLERGIPESESLAVLKKIQNPEPKWFRYFEAMGVGKGAN